MDDKRKEFGWRRTQIDAFEDGIRAARSFKVTVTIPYNSPYLAKKFVEGFETVRPWPY